MRKRIITSLHKGPAAGEQDWLDLEALAEVEISSEDSAHPIEAALLPGDDRGWRAAAPGRQTIRLRFAEPLRLHHVRLEFVETVVERSQEYVLRYSGDGGRSFHDIVRQQWNFSPLSSPAETEDHHVSLPGVTLLELVIVPDISGGGAIASLARMRVA